MEATIMGQILFFFFLAALLVSLAYRVRLGSRVWG